MVPYHDDSSQAMSSQRVNEPDRALSGLSPFEQLPQELAWKIVEYAHESVFNLQLTSRLLNLRVREFALEQDTLGLVKSLDIDRSTKDVVKLLVLVDQSNLFELRLKLRFLHDRFMRREFGNYREYTLVLDCSTNTDAELMRTLKECIGNHVNKAILNYYWRSGSGALPETYEHVKEMHFDSLRISEFYLNDALLNELPSIIQKHKANHFSLSVGEVSSDGIVDMLLKIASHVRSMSLHQMSVYRRHTDNYFMGATDVDWAQVIIDMFSKKMDKLSIENPSFPQYLPKDKVDRLADTLPVMGKKVWFEAITCSNFDPALQPLNYVSNDHIVKAEISTVGIASLSVKHSSRELEQGEKCTGFHFPTS